MHPADEGVKADNAAGEQPIGNNSATFAIKTTIRCVAAADFVVPHKSV